MITAHSSSRSVRVATGLAAIITMLSLSMVTRTFAQDTPVQNTPGQTQPTPPQNSVFPGAPNQNTPNPTPEIRFEEPAVPAEVPNQVTLTAIPPRVGENQELKAKPGETIQTMIRVRNSSDQPVRVGSIVEDFIVADDGITPISVTDTTSNRWSLASWVTVSPANQLIQPNQTANVNLVISVPEDALPGGHYAMVLHEPNINTGAGAELVSDPASQSRVAQRVGTLLYFLVEGPINEEAFIRNFQFKDFSEYGPVPFSFSVENMSDIHIRPQFEVVVKNIFGQEVDSLTVESKNVFPLLSRDFDGQWDRVWGIGPYNATLTMSFGTQGQIVVASDQFWLLPYKLVIAGGATLIALIAVIILVRRHMIHRNANEQARIQELEQRLQELESEKTKKFDE